MRGSAPLAGNANAPTSETGHLVEQRKRSYCGIAGPVVVTLRHLGVQNAKRDSEHEGSDGDDALGHHEAP